MTNTWIKRMFMSILIGLVLTFGIGGLKYLVLDKPGFDPLGSCGSNPLCDPSPYLSIGIPWQYGSYNDASGNTAILGFGVEDEELTMRYYRGFIVDIALYTVLAFGAFVLVARVRKKAS